MGLWGGFSTSIKSGESISKKEMSIARQIAEREILKAKIKADAAGTLRSIAGADARQAVGFEVGRAAAIAQRQSVDFSFEEQALRSMFGHGEHFWAIPDSETGVRINHTLNPSKVDDTDETSSLFGFGGQGERSGLF